MFNHNFILSREGGQRLIYFHSMCPKRHGFMYSWYRSLYRRLQNFCNKAWNQLYLPYMEGTQVVRRITFSCYNHTNIQVEGPFFPKHSAISRIGPCICICSYNNYNATKCGHINNSMRSTQLYQPKYNTPHHYSSPRVNTRRRVKMKVTITERDISRAADVTM